MTLYSNNLVHQVVVGGRQYHQLIPVGGVVSGHDIITLLWQPVSLLLEHMIYTNTDLKL